MARLAPTAGGLLPIPRWSWGPTQLGHAEPVAPGWPPRRRTAAEPSAQSGAFGGQCFLLGGLAAALSGLVQAARGGRWGRGAVVQRRVWASTKWLAKRGKVRRQRRTNRVWRNKQKSDLDVAADFREGLERFRDGKGIEPNELSSFSMPLDKAERRQTGNISFWKSNKRQRDSWGYIRFGGKDVYVLGRMVPTEFYEQHKDGLPEGTPVEFKIAVRHQDGKHMAVDLDFPIANNFAALGLTDEVVRGAANALGCDPRENPTAPELIIPAPVQVEAIPRMLRGEQILVAAETGSGKSLAYMLPLVQKLREIAQAPGNRTMDFGLETRLGSPLAVCICPTRELTMQAGRTLKLICHEAKQRVRIVHGGEGLWAKQRRELSQIVDILVGTPDRILKMHERSIIQFRDVRFVTIDEADFALTQGFEGLYDLLEAIEKGSKHQRHEIFRTLITASITKPLLRILQHDPRYKKMHILESKSLHKPQQNCSHSFIFTKGRDKLDLLSGLLQQEIRGIKESRQTMVFCNTVSSANAAAHELRKIFIKDRCHRFIGTMHKDMDIAKRDEELKKFASGEYKVLVCSDVAQRGLDLPNCKHVVNFDFPLNSIDYLHRAGRTARYGESGKVTSLVKKGDRYLATAIEKATELGKPIDSLSGDRRDYLRGGALHHLVSQNPAASAKERGLPENRPYAGSLR